MSNKLSTTLLLTALATHLDGCAPRQAYYNTQQTTTIGGQSHYQVERDLNFALQAQSRILDKPMAPGYPMQALSRQDEPKPATQAEPRITKRGYIDGYYCVETVETVYQNAQAYDQKALQCLDPQTRQWKRIAP